MSETASAWPNDIFICIPAYQAAATLPKLIPKLLRRVPASQVCIVDDGSTDGTADYAKNCGTLFLSHAENRGKGVALATGFAALLEQGAEAIITMDADGQHAVDDLPLFVDAFRSHPAMGICSGRRDFSRKQMPIARIFSNTVTSLALSWLCRVDIPDSQCGYRLYAGQFLRAVTITCPRFAVESEVLIKAARLGFPIRFVNVQTLYFSGASHISHLYDTVRWLRAVLSVTLSFKRSDRNFSKRNVE